MLQLAITGAAGRMGQTLAGLIAEAPDLRLTGALEHAGSHSIGQKLGDCAISADPTAALSHAQVLVDFSLPIATIGLCDAAIARGAAMVIGTTGLAAEQEKAIHTAAKKIPVVYSGNYSLGVNVLTTLVERAAAALPPDLFDIEIFEAHHSAKVDAPSGTALWLGRVAAESRGQKLDDVMVPARHGHTGERPDGAIGFSVARGGDAAGEHTVFFFGPQERIELTHRASNRSIFARGALHAARWVIAQPPGLYSMRDVLGLN